MSDDLELAALRHRRAKELMSMQTSTTDLKMAPEQPLAVTDASFQQTQRHL